MKKIIGAAVGAVILAVGGLYFAGFIHIGGEKAEEESVPVVEVPPSYLTLDPPFVVNFTHRGTLRYLQVSIDVSYKDAALLAKVTERMPEIRNDLILLFSNQDYEKLSTRAGKEQLRHEIFAAINHVIGVVDPLEALHNTPLGLGSAPTAELTESAVAEATLPQLPATLEASKIGEVFITNFVMQ